MSERLLAKFSEVAERTARAYGLVGAAIVGVDSRGHLHVSVSTPTDPEHVVAMTAALKVAANQVGTRPAELPTILADNVVPLVLA